MNDIDARTVKSTARTYRNRFGTKAREQATLRAVELEALRSSASTFWWAVVAELEGNSVSDPAAKPNPDHQGC